MGTSSPPASPPSVSISKSSVTTSPTPQTPPNVLDAAAPEMIVLPNSVEEKLHLSHFQILDSREYIDKQKRYEAEYTRRLMAKYFSKKDLFGGDIHDEKMTVDGETISSSRWCCTQSFADTQGRCLRRKAVTIQLQQQKPKHSVQAGGANVRAAADDILVLFPDLYEL